MLVFFSLITLQITFTGVVIIDKLDKIEKSLQIMDTYRVKENAERK